MKAAVYYGPGDVRIEDVREPEPPGPAEVVIQVKMGSLCGTDASQYKAATMVPLHGPHRVSGHSGPVILGHEVVGIVVARGAEATHLELGQRVVPGAGWWCGECPRCKEGRINICENYYLYGIHANGGLAEFARFPAQMSMPVPPECSDEAAAMAQPCAVALHALARGRIAIDQEKDIVTTNGQICGIDLPNALELLSTTDLAQRISYRLISLDALVEEGLMPLVEHRATAKVVVAI